MNLQAWRHPHDPGHRAVRRASRTALVMTASFLFGRYVLDNSQFAVMATFTGAALLGIADFSGERRERIRASICTLSAGAGLLALGTAVSSNTAAATVTMFVVTLVVGYSAVFSGYFAAASNAVIVFYVVATGITGPPSSIPAREAGLAVGGALSVLAAGWLWPSRAAAETRRSLADVYRLLARVVGDLSSGRRAEDPEEVDRQLGSAILETEQAIARSAWRPDGLAGPHKARMYLLQGARRMSELIAGLERLPRDRRGGAHDDAVRLEQTLSRLLQECAAGILRGPLPDPTAAETATTRFAEQARVEFVRRAKSGARGEELQDAAAATFLLHQLGWGVSLAALHCRAMSNAPIGSAGDAARSWLVNVLFDGPSVRKWIRRARRNLTPRSVHFQNSIRLATGLALARLAVGVLDLKHGFWVGFATLVVLKTSAAGTRSTAVQAAFGTTIGFGLSSLLISTFGVHAAVYAIVLPVVIFAAFYLPGTVSFVAGQAFFTMVIVVLFNLVKPAGWTVGLLRLEDVLVGAAIGLVIGMAIWPRGAGMELRRVVARLFVQAAAFVRATAFTVIAPPPSPPEASAVSSPFPVALGLAALDVEDVFSQYLSEPHQSDAPVMDWASLVGAAHRLWFGAAVAALIPPIAPDCTPSQADLRTVSQNVDALEDDYQRVACCLLEGAPLDLVPVPPFEITREGMAAEDILTFMEVGSWLAQLSSGLEDVRRTLLRLGIPATGSTAVVSEPSAAAAV